MVVSCWSAKGGSGTTVVAVAMAALLGRRSEDGSLLVDLDGDCPTVLGVPESDGPGVTDWLGASASVPDAAVARLERSVAPSIRLVHRGRRAPCCAERAERLMDLLAADPRPVVIDVGRVVDGGSEADEVRRMVAISAKVSLLVTRACYLSLRRSLALSWRPTGVVLVEEDSRALGRADVEDVLGVPVVASIAIDPVIARAVDSGLLASRLPPGLSRSLADVA
jgi:hypothetical protein